MSACKQQYFRDWNLLSVGELIFPSYVSDHPHRTLLRKAGKCQTETMYYYEMGSRSAAFQWSQSAKKVLKLLLKTVVGLLRGDQL